MIRREVNQLLPITQGIVIIEEVSFASVEKVEKRKIQ